MELTCLNCAGTFEIDDDLGLGERLITCPLCSKEQRFAPHEEAPFDPSPVSAPIQPAQVEAAPDPSSDSSGFRKPMQAFSSFARRQVNRADEEVEDTSRMKRLRRGQGQDTPWDGGMPRIEKEQPEQPTGETAADQGDGEDENGSGLWLVRSPTGMVLEFPSSQLLINWSAIVEKPAPYSVSKGGDEWQALSEFLEEVRQGNRGTSAFRRLAQKSMDSSKPDSDVLRIPGNDGTDGGQGSPDQAPVGDEKEGKDSRSEVRLTSSPTSQFKFKTIEAKEKRGRRWILFAVVGAFLLLAAGGVAGLYFAGLL